MFIKKVTQKKDDLSKIKKVLLTLFKFQPMCAYD